MKNLVIFLVVVNINVIFGQELLFNDNSCDDAKFYRVSLDDLWGNSSKLARIDFSFEISSSLEKSIKNSDLFQEKELPIIFGVLNFPDKRTCDEITTLLVRKNSLNRPPDSGTPYDQVNYSNPIRISDFKVYLFVEKKSLVSDDKIKGGAVILEVFKKNEELWTLDKKLLVEQY